MVSAYQEIIDKVLDQLENGIVPWKMAYTYLAKSHSTKRPYSILNQLLLERPGTYWTFKQIQDAGLRIRKGSKAARCVFWKILKVKDKDGESTNDVPYLRYYTVFHESDIEGLPKVKKDEEIADFEKADAIIANYLMMNPEINFVEIAEAMRPPAYKPKSDVVRVHPKSYSESEAEYYSTVFHELIHSTGHKDRLNRLPDSVDEIEEYSKEELIAEIGSAMLCASCGIKTTIDNSASYCAGWAKRIKDNKTWLNRCGSLAEEAIDYLLIGIEED